MIRFLLLTFLMLIGSFTVSLAQGPIPDANDEILGKASMFAVLSSNNVTNTGATVVIGNLGTGTGNLIDNGQLSVTEKEIQTTTAKVALSDATAAYAELSARTPNRTLTSFPNSFEPGVHVINGNANLNEALNGSIEFNGKGNPDAKFFVIVKGNMTYTLPPGGITSLRVANTNGAEAKNIYWIVEGSVSLAGISLFQGNIIAQKDITLRQRVYLTGRTFSLTGNVNLNGNLVFLPSVILTDLSIKKVAEEGEYTVGANIKYTITVTNSGPGTAENVIVQENFPRSGLAFISAEPGKGVFKEDTDGQYRWYVGNMENDETAVLIVTFKLLANGTVENQVIIEPNPNNPDPNPDDNTDTDPVPVTCKDPGLTISGETDLCAIPNEVVYTVTEVVGGKYTFTLPDGIERISAVDETSNAIRVRVTKPGEIKVSVLDQCGQTYETTQAITVAGVPVTPTIEGDFEVCADSNNLTYRATGVAEGASLRWIATGVTIVGPDNQNSVVVNVGKTGGTLSVQITSKCSIVGLPKVEQIQVIQAPAAPANISGLAEVCEGSEQTYTASAVTGALSYTWGFPNDWEVVPGTPEDEQTIRVIVGATAGNISVKAIGRDCGPGAPVSKNIIVNSKPPTVNIKGGGALV
ncbi:ice-binding family protein [Pontibacter rugosus]